MKVFCHDCKYYIDGGFYCKKEVYDKEDGISHLHVLIPSIHNDKNKCRFFEKRIPFATKVTLFLAGIVEGFKKLTQLS